MNTRFKAISTLLHRFARYANHVREILIFLVVLIFVGGIAISQVENIPVADSIYFSFITGLSIGYGDITPKTLIGQVLSIGIGLIGMIFVGFTVAIATQALRDSLSD